MLTADQTRHFKDRGYLVAEDILDLERDIAPVVAEYTNLLDRLLRTWHAEGRLPSDYADLPFAQRLVRAIEGGQACYQHFDICLPQSRVAEDTPFHAGPGVFNLLRSPRLLDAVESLIGPEIYCNPVQHVRIKPPERYVTEAQRGFGLVATTPWHQDLGVVLPEADASNILTVWLPITESTIENGCMLVVPDSARADLVTHCPSPVKGAHIPDPLVPDERVTPLPMRPGSVLFMHRRTMHASLPNRSDGVRWSFDLRYNPTGQPTGRPAFPGFVARSRKDPASELRDPATWHELWRQTRTRLAEQPKPTFNRWSDKAPVCA